MWLVLLLIAVGVGIAAYFMRDRGDHVSLTEHYPPTPEYDSTPHLFVGTRTKHTEKQISYADAKLKQYDLITEQPARQARVTELEKSTQQTQLDQLKLQRELIAKASLREVDLPIHNQLRLQEESLSTELEKARGLADIEIDKHLRMTEIELKKIEAEKQIHIRALEQAKQVEMRYSSGHLREANSGKKLSGGSPDSDRGRGNTPAGTDPSDETPDS